MLAAVERLINSYLGAGVLVIFAVAGLVAALLARPLARRWGTSRAAATLAVLSLIAILTVTLGVRLRGTLRLAFDVSWLHDDFLWQRVVEADGEWLLNVLLFVPAGLFVARANRRPLRTIAGLVALSFVIELVQGFTGLGFADPADLVANSIGAVAGALLAVLLRLVWPVDPDRRWSRRGVVFACVAVVALAGVSWLGGQAAANTRQAQLADRLVHAFEGTTSADVAALMASPDGMSRLAAAAKAWPDYVGEVGSSGEWEGRWSTDVLALYRCVLVRWSEHDVTVHNLGGSGCTDFRDRPPALPPGRGSAPSPEDVGGAGCVRVSRTY